MCSKMFGWLFNSITNTWSLTSSGKTGERYSPLARSQLSRHQGLSKKPALIRLPRFEGRASPPHGTAYMYPSDPARHSDLHLGRLSTVYSSHRFTSPGVGFGSTSVFAAEVRLGALSFATIPASCSFRPSSSSTARNARSSSNLNTCMTRAQTPNATAGSPCSTLDRVHLVMPAR
jgi:hypothetical protein